MTIKKGIIAIGLLAFISFSHSIKAQTILQVDTTNNPCHQFKELKTANDYFQSANNRTKNCCCPNDSLTINIATKEYGLAVKLDPKYWQARRNYARQLINLKQYDLAIEQLNQTLKLVSSEANPDLNVMRGQAYYEKGNYQKAIDDFDIALKFQGNIDFTLLCKAKAQWKFGQKDKACENYKKAIALSPHLADMKEFIQCN
jgi:tetratricopeptide (TPR) repeat protein